MSVRQCILLCSVTILGIVGFSCSTSLPERIGQIIDEYRSPQSPGGCLLVANNDSIIYVEAFGLADLEARTPNTAKTNFRLASVTKQFTAMAILILRERQSLRLDQTLKDFFPHFSPVGGTITVQHLLTHTSGLVAYEDVMPETTTVPLLDRDVLTLVQSVDTTYFPPGTSYRYSNTGYALLALIVERVSGMSFASYLKANIFDPLGMHGTVAFENRISEVRNRAYGYSPAESGTPGYVRTDQSTTSSVLGDGGIYSSVGDLWLWHQALFTEKLVSKSTLDEAMTPHVTSPDGTVKYGYGWMIGDIHGLWEVHHSGTTIGFRNSIILIPDRKMVVIVLMNRSDGTAERIAREVAEVVLREKRTEH